MSIHEMLQWWNLIYLAPLLVSLVWILATVFTGAHGDGGAHGGHGIGHDVGHGVGHDIGHAVHHVGHTIEHAIHHGDVGHSHTDVHSHGTHSHQSHAGSEHNSFGQKVLSILGIGQVPITLLIGIFLLCWGMFGMLANKFFAPVMKFPAIYIWPSMGATFFASAVFTRSMAAIVGRLMPNTETYGVSRLELVGSLGTTVFPTNETTGTIHVKDTYGTVHRVQAKTEDGAKPIPSGKEVMILDFDEEDKRFVVRISML